MSDKDMENIVEALYNAVLKRLKNDDVFQNVTKTKNATVTSVPSDVESNTGLSVNLRLPYDSNSFPAINRSGENLSVGDLVCFEYWTDLKNAVVKYKVN